jgi:uncharacterized circularly permuted ATP-grasp superfamily protein/uncharacterized alpha-E superfamily protein
MNTDNPANADRPDLFAQYQPRPLTFDEMQAEDAQRRPHWASLADSLTRLGFDELAARRESARRILREHGVTYNVYGDVQGLGRPWDLDLMPMLIPPEEWQTIEAGLQQRTRLFNRVLQDMYGAQELVREGWLPPALVHANPAFLPPCHGVPHTNGTPLFLHAVDLARGPDGRWWVLADRTQAPSGVGYALENRLVVSRLMPDEFHAGRVRRLAEFFQTAREGLRQLAPQANDMPRVVLLTPGPYNETYFEHVFLARYLGFTLVEGADLTVRDRRVFIKTLEGLRRVDVILRRVDDTYCDPLELRADSFLGVPGLLEAVRAGQVTVANALGAGAVEAPAMLPFLPGLCRHLLGEELKLPSVATWWCGQGTERAYTLEHLDHLVIKPAFSPAVADPLFGQALDAVRRQQLEAAIRLSPTDYVGQEHLTLSTVPVMTRQGWEARPMVLRVFVCAVEGACHVMPGGLARVAGSVGEPVVSMQSGGTSKDLWVPGTDAVSSLTLLKTSSQVLRLYRLAAEVPSRVADNLYWLGRYAERLEDTVRTLRCVLIRIAGESGSDKSPETEALVRLLAELDLLPARFQKPAPPAILEREVLQQIYHQNRLGSVCEVLGRLKQIAFAVRDRFSTDTWSIITQLQIEVRRPARARVADALSQLNQLIVNLAAFSGMEMENMTRGHGWRFLDIGRRLERSINVVTLVQGALALQPDPVPALEPMLEIADSVMTYRRRYFARPELATVLDLLLEDDSNPRSLAFQLAALADHAGQLPRETRAEEADSAAGHIAGAVALLRAMDLAAINCGGGVPVAQALAGLAEELRLASNRITFLYFSHAPARVSA